MKGRREEQRRRAHGNRNRRRCHGGSRCVYDGITARQNPPSPSSLRIDREESLAPSTRTDKYELSKAVAKSRAHGNRKLRRCHDGSRCVHGSITARHNPPSSSSLRIDREEPLAHRPRTDKHELLKAVVKSSVVERTAIESVAVATTAADMCMTAPRRSRICRRRAHFE